MKLHFINLVCFIFFIGFSIRSIECIGENAILELLEEIRKRMCHPIPKFGLPALDPFQIKHFEYGTDNKYLVDFKGSITNFYLTGLSDFIVNDLKISSNPLRRSVVDVTLPMTAFQSLYTAKGSLAYILNLAGDGNARASLDTLRLKVSWQLRAGIYLNIRNLQITINIGGLEIDLENFIEEDRINKFFHALINELGLELLDDVWKQQNKHVEQLIEKKINALIGRYSLADIIKLVGGSGGGEPIFGENDPPGDCKNQTFTHGDNGKMLL